HHGPAGGLGGRGRPVRDHRDPTGAVCSDRLAPHARRPHLAALPQEPDHAVARGDEAQGHLAGLLPVRAVLRRLRRLLRVPAHDAAELVRPRGRRRLLPMAGFVIVAVLMRPLGGILSDRIGAVRTLLCSYIAVAAAALMLAFQPALMPLGTIDFIVMAAGLGLGSGAVFALVSQTSDPSRGR